MFYKIKLIKVIIYKKWINQIIIIILLYIYNIYNIISFNL